MTQTRKIRAGSDLR